MERLISTMVAIGCLAVTGVASASEVALSKQELARCANQVHALREESGRLLQQNARLDTRRISINQRAADIAADKAAIDPDDLRANLALREKRKLYNEDTAVFNAEIERLKREIVSVNQVKQQYHNNCSNRPYKRADLEALPDPARSAMRAGLSDVVVPYID